MAIRSYLSLGSNIEPQRHLLAALVALQDLSLTPLQLSPWYRCPAVGFVGADFYNGVVGLDSDLTPAALASACRAIETAEGRQRGAEKFAARTLDIDLLLHGEQVGAKLPHPDVLRYAFVLKPLADLYPEGHHPLLGLTYARLWQRWSGVSDLTLLPGLREQWLTQLRTTG